METTQRINISSSTNKITVPFYAPPPCVKKTSAEIISEARASIIRDNEGIRIESTRMAASIRPVNTKRPFTPREKQRTLFGTARRSNCRPPSSFSLDYLQFQDADLSSSMSARKLNPIPTSASLNTSSSLVDLRDWKTLLTNTCIEGSAIIRKDRILSAQPFGTASFLSPEQIGSAANKFRLPSIDSAGKPVLNRRHQFRATASLDNLPEELEIDESDSEDSGANLKDVTPPRKAYSSPVQRTTSMDTEMERCIVKKKLSGKQPAINLDLGTSQQDRIVGNSSGDSGRNIVDDSKYQKIQNNVLQGDSSHVVKDMKESSLILGKQVPNKIKSPLQPSSEIAINKECDKRDNVKTSKQKKKSTCEPEQEKRRKSETDKENASQERHLDDGVFGPELGGSNVKKKAKSPKTEADPQEKQKSGTANVKVNVTSSNLNENVKKHISKSDSSIKQSSLKQKSILNDNWVTENQNKMVVENITESQPQNMTQESKKQENVDSHVEIKAKRTLHQAKQTDAAENYINTRKKSKSEKHSVNIIEEKMDTVQSIITALNSLVGKEDCTEVTSLMSKLYSALESEGVIGKNTQNTKLRGQVLKTLYKFVESSNETLLLQIARIILAFRVSGSNLTGVCKLVFKVSRCDKNDRLFMEDNILELFVEALGSASPLEDAESCVYGYGALKFLTMNNILLAKVLKLGILELMVLHMKMVNTARADGSRIPEQTSHALFQLTGALRNVAGEEEMFAYFVTTGAVVELCKAMELFSSDLDVISNISRTLSIISTHDDCCTAIVDYENSFNLFVKLFQKYPGRQDIIVRLGYALGNLMAHSDVARIKFFSEDGAVMSMLNLLAIYLDKDLHMLGSAELNSYQSVNSDAGSNGSVEDVLVKMIRIVANMSINPMVGSSLACSSPMFYSNNVQKIEFNQSETDDTRESSKDGGQFLDVLLTVLRRKSVTESEELVHSVLSTLNNLSYYPTGNDGAFGERQLEIAQALCSLLNTDNKECLVEVTRVYGNLTRSKDIRDFLIESGSWNQLLKFLDWDDQELLCTTAGILVNMMADWDKRLALKEGHGIERLTAVLKKFGEGDWQLATLVCQALWNYCIESTNLHAAFGIEETNCLLGILVDLLDEERLFGVVEGTEVNETLATSEHYQMWEEFAGVATNLLEKMEIFLDSLEPLEPLEIFTDHQNLTFSHSESEYHVL